jgi:DNA topoisomerase-1
MRDTHAKVNGSSVRFEFRGKSGKPHRIDLHDIRLVRIVKACRELPGYELFQYVDDAGERKGIESSDVNDYIKSICNEPFTAKDFRTWAGTVMTALELARFPPHRSHRAAKQNIVRAIETVAARLGNTSSVCRKCYIHPRVLDAYMAGDVVKRSTRRQTGRGRLSPHESAVVALIERRRSRAA